jgi:hypothetical protein
MWKFITLFLVLFSLNLFGASPSFQQVTNIVLSLSVTSNTVALYTIQTNFTAGRVTVYSTNITADTPLALYRFSGTNLFDFTLYGEMREWRTNGCATIVSSDVNDTNELWVTIQPSMLYVSGLASTNGNYQSMTVGTSTVALGGWPTDWLHATNADYAGQASHATNADYSTQSLHSTNSDLATHATEATHSTNADVAASGWPVQWPWASITNPPVIPSTNGFVDQTITNSLATTNYVNAATNNLPASIWTLGTASQSNSAAFDLAGAATAATNNYPWNGVSKVIGVTNYITMANDVDVPLFAGGTNQLLTTSNMLTSHFLIAFMTNVNGSIIVTNPSHLVLGALSRTITNGQHIAVICDGAGNLN